MPPHSVVSCNAVNSAVDQTRAEGDRASTVPSRGPLRPELPAQAKLHSERAWRTSLTIWLITAAIGAAALLPRVAGLADFYTMDEAFHWSVRTRHFLQALQEGNWAGTNLTGHPGVTTLWLGTLGRALAPLFGVQPASAGDGATFLAFLRFPLALVNSLTVVVGYVLLRRLFDPTTALVSALLLAASPFVIAHSRLLHLDGLLTSFLTLSLLLMLVGGTAATSSVQIGDAEPGQRGRGGEYGWLLLSSVMAGLALLTKGPSLAFLPIAGLLLLYLSPPGALARRVRWAARRYLLWLGCAVVVIWVGWPAMWVTPGEALSRVFREVVANGGQPHLEGNYFRGRPVADPGWLFYPAVVLWRTTPWTLLGLALLPFALREGQYERRTIASLACFVLLFGVAMSLGAKKFDRYLLPAWPAVEILSATGLVAAARWTSSKLGSKVVRSRASRLLAFGMLALALLLTALNYHPYYLAYFNPLLGGGPTAERVLLVGWGEGMEQVGAWLSRRPDVSNGPVLSWFPPVLTPFVPARVDDFDAATVHQPSSYAVLYVRGRQREEVPDIQAYIRQTPPLYTLRIHGIDYATVHQIPRPFTEPVDAIFGDGLRLRGFSHSWEGSTLTITPSWDVQRSQPAGRFFFVHVLGADGSRLAQADVAVDDGMFAEWQAGQQFGRALSLPLPEPLPPGPYRVVLGVYDPTTGARLPLSQGAARSPEIDGPHAVELMSLRAP